MSFTVLSVASRAVLDACTQLGLDADAILQSSGVARDRVFDPDARISDREADAIWMHASQRACDPNLALRAAQALPFGAYKVLDFIAANAPTVGEGLRRIARYFLLVDARARIDIEEGNDTVALVFSSETKVLPPAAQQYTFAALVQRSRASSGTNWPLAAAEFSFPAPDDLQLYDEIFGCPLRFSSKRARLLLSRSSWQQAITGADEALFSVLDDHAGRLVAEIEIEPKRTGIIDQLREELRQRLRGGDSDIASVAQSMAMSERTLQRRLDEHGRTYSEVLSDVRHELGREYLRTLDVSIAEVAFLLGFSDQSAFGRAFKRWTGQTPRAWRLEHAG